MRKQTKGFIILICLIGIHALILCLFIAILQAINARFIALYILIFLCILCALDILFFYTLPRIAASLARSLIRLTLVFMFDKARSRTIKARIHTRQKRYDLAFRDLNQAIALDPKRGETYCERAFTYWALKDYSRALEDCNQALSYRPESFYPYYCRGVILCSLKEYDQAIKDLSQALFLARKTQSKGNALLWRGKVYQYMGDHQMALQDFQAALTFSRQKATIYNQYGLSSILLKNYSQALRAFNQAITLQPRNGCFYDNRGKVYLGLNQIQQASADFAQSWKLDPTHIIHKWHLEWCKLCEQKPDQETARHLRTLTRIDPEHPRAHICTGIADWLDGNNEKALAELIIAEQTETSLLHWDAQFWKGVILASLGRDDEAKVSIQHALAETMPPILLSPLRWVKPELYQELVLAQS